MKKILKLTFALGCACACAGSMLFYANEQTAPIIAQKESKQKLEIFRKILPEFDNQLLDEKLTVENVTFYVAKKDQKVVGIAAETSAKGYGGDMKILMSITTKGQIDWIQILSHSETPGIGTRVTDRVRKKTIFDFFRKNKKQDENRIPNAHLDQYNGKELNDQIKVDAVGGATITSRGVAAAVKQIADLFQIYGKKLLADSSASSKQGTNTDE